MGRGGKSLTCAGVFAILMCTFSVSSTLHASSDDEGFINIRQVTDNNHNRRHRHHHHLLGTATELHFKSFVKEYGKEYSTHEEYVHRLGVFAKNLLRAAEHQAMDPTAIHGVTQFSDLTEDEFEKMYMGVKGGSETQYLSKVHLQASTPTSTMDVGDLPKNFDWREKGAVTDVKMQGTCGSCWAFSTTGAIEGANFVATGKLVSLSEQQLVDCDHKCDDANDKDSCDDGCSGGLMTNAYNYLIEAGGIEDESSYPYTGKSGVCKFKPEKIAVRIQNFTTVSGNEEQIAAHLVHNGPLAVGLNAVFMQTYIGGVSCPLICSKKSLNHGVLLVGYGSTGFSILRLAHKPYWIMKNSWGRRWGEHGYYKMCRGHNMCGINTMVSAVITQAS